MSEVISTVLNQSAAYDSRRRTRRSEFDYALPPDLIAQSPVSPRDHSRLMVVKSSASTLQHQRYFNLGQWLQSGDVLVLNATRVFPARLRGQKRSGGKVDVLLLRAVSDD